MKKILVGWVMAFAWMGLLCPSEGEDQLSSFFTPPPFTDQRFFIGHRLQDVLWVDLNQDGKKDFILFSVEDEGPEKGLQRFMSVVFNQIPSSREEQGTSPVGETVPHAPSGKEKVLPGVITWRLHDEERVAFPFQYRGRQEIILAGPHSLTQVFWNGKTLERQPLPLKISTLILPAGYYTSPILHWNLDVSRRLHGFLLPESEGMVFYQWKEKSDVWSRTVLSGVDVEYHWRRKTFLNSSSFRLTQEISYPNAWVGDVNQDGLDDLVLMSGNRLYYFFQDRQGGFSSRPSKRVVLPYTAEELSIFRGSFVRLVDLNGDGAMDLVIERIQLDVEQVERTYTQIDVFFGAPGKVPIFQKPDLLVKVPGLSIFPQIYDVNGDGLQDIVVSSINTNLLSQAVRVGLLGNIVMNFFVLLGHKAQRVPATYQARYDRYIHIKPELLEEDWRNSAAMRFDVDWNGDHRSDLLELDSAHGLQLHLGLDTGGKDTLYYSKDDYYQAKLKGMPKRLWVDDFNGDGKTDILMLYTTYIRLIQSRAD